MRLSLASMLVPLALLAGCASAAGGGGGRTLAAGGSATLSVGESVRLPDASTLTYAGVTSDSRCPPKVQCIQAGEAVVAFRHADAAGSHDLQLRTGDDTGASLAGGRLVLAALTFDAPPKATVRLDPAG